MNPRRRLLASAIAAPLVLAGCKIRTINYFPVKAAHVRFVNVMLDSTGLDVRDGETTIWTGIGFEGSTGFVDFDNVEKTFKVRETGGSTDLASTTLALAGETPYTLVALGAVDAPGLLLAADVSASSGSGNIQIRLLNVSFGVSAIDIYVTAPDVVIDNNVFPSFVAINPGSSTSSLRFAAGTYRIRATPNGSKTVVYDSGPIAFPGNTSTDILFYTLGSASLPQVMLLDVDGAGVRAVAPNALTAIKVVNAAAQTGTINVLLDGTRIMSDLAYPAASAYAFQAAGAHLLAIEAASVPGAIIASLQRTFDSASDVSVMVVGFPGALQAIALADDNRSLVSGKTRVRLVNASSDNAAYDVFVGDTKQVPALAARTASAYFLFDAGNYTVSFRDPVTGAVMLTIADTELADRQVTSFYLTGSAGQLASIKSTDR